MESEAVKHVGVSAYRDAGFASLDGPKSSPRHSRTPGDELHGEATTKPSEADVLAQLLEKPLY